MPAFATFFKVHVAQSDSFQAFRSLFTKKSPGASTFHSEPQTPLRTFGSSGPKVHPYYELPESALLKSQCTTSGEVMVTTNIPNAAIVRSVDIYQQTDDTFLKSEL